MVDAGTFRKRPRSNRSLENLNLHTMRCAQCTILDSFYISVNKQQGSGGWFETLLYNRKTKCVCSWTKKKEIKAVVLLKWTQHRLALARRLIFRSVAHQVYNMMSAWPLSRFCMPLFRRWMGSCCFCLWLGKLLHTIVKNIVFLHRF